MKKMYKTGSKDYRAPSPATLSWAISILAEHKPER